MREKLTEYIDLLFAGTSDTDDIRQEIAQNTLDKFDDLIAQGKTPEAAYRIAISGIGDVNEILGRVPLDESAPSIPEPEAATIQDAPFEPTDDAPAPANTRLLNAIATALYILCPVPLFLEGSSLGLCGLLLMVAIATGIKVYTDKRAPKEPVDQVPTKHSPARKNARRIIWLCAIVIYLLISFLTGAWYITWMMFLIAPCCTALWNAIQDLKEAMKK
ncbi:MAG: hypothetical protein IJW45_06500 [Oscillospiraceae bacterium]|nr:hypothetical protein [Oscillospiraceae bacterium]